MGLVTIFLGVEERRYRAYDVWRSRVRMLEEELFAQLFDSDRELEHDDWRQMMSDDLRAPTTKIGVGTTVARRLRRVYLPLLGVLLAAWIVKITVFQPGPDGIEGAAIPPIPGSVVIVAVTAFYVGAVVVVLWPRPDEVPPEVDDKEVGAWRRD